MRLYKDKPDYVRLDDDVSFQIVRTNPKLTTNTKLVYDGENLYMDSYPVNQLLSTMKYKHHRVWRTGLFNRDIRNFLLGTNTSAYEVGKKSSDTVILNNFDDQFENIYWCGVEPINSDIYPQEMGCIAPLYIRKKMPNYFVIFKIDNPTNTNMNKSDAILEFDKDILNKAKILKSFDLREGTPIGDYIKRYVEQKEFKYDQSVYVNFSSHEIYYYGIDKSLGVLTQKVENFEEDLLKNDNPMMKDDKWITSGFERNNLIFPYILNLEFLFDDTDIGEYKFGRYFGMYCNDIDLYDLNIGGCTYDKDYGYTVLTTGWDNEDHMDLYGDSFYYIKDKYRNIHSINSTYVPGMYKVPGKVEGESLKGFEATSVSTYAERIPGVGKACMILEIVEKLDKDETLTVYDEISASIVGKFVASTQYPKGEFYENRFSCKGTLQNMAYALAGCIRCCTTDNFNWVTAFSVDNKVVIQALYPGANLNNLFNFAGSTIKSYPYKIKKLMPSFVGGTDKNNCMFKVYTEDMDVFMNTSNNDRDEDRYLKCGIGKNNAKILAVLPYITEDNKIDDTYSVVITDENGPYVNVAKTNQFEILDVFYPKIGILSFFPVRDFDFDTVYSQYGDYSMLQKELKEFQKSSFSNKSASEGDIRLNKAILDVVPYKRFYDGNKDINTEYDYYCENILPELSVDNKTVPYIAKWGYTDESKDSCENPYRLNANKIFDTCNFSANTFSERGNINEYTHSMPYYLVYAIGEDRNEYQYVSTFTNTYDSLVEYFTRKKSDGLGDPFDEMFGNVSNTNFTNKRFNKKYSRFLLGNDVVKSSTLFRGVKFEITEYENGKEVKTGKYNDYRFCFIYVPVNGIENDTHTVHFIKNDDYKFIVGMVMFDIKTNVEYFNKAFVYAGCMGFLKRT